VQRQAPAVPYLLEGNKALQAAPLGVHRLIGEFGH
jgi:hypothetical protein